MRSIAWLLLAAVLSPLCASAADGDLDPAFGTGGIVEIGWPAGPAQANAVGLDHSGRLLVGGAAIGVYGNADFALFRLLPEGTLDTTYAADGGGFRLIDFDLDGIGGNSPDTINDLAVLDDGSVVSVGEAHFGYDGVNSQFALARVDATGTLDPSFGRNGSAHFGFDSFANIDYGRLLAVDAQGRIAVAGMVSELRSGSFVLDWWLGLARLTPQGQLDSSFYGGGYYSTIFWVDPNIPPPGLRHSLENVPFAFALDAAARILTAGIVQQPIPQDAAVYRAPVDGGYDLSFGQYARVQLGLSQGEASALLPLSAGGMLVAGTCATATNTNSLFLARLLDDGSRDVSFGTNGITTIPLSQGYPEPSLIAPTREGGWLVAGQLTGTSSGGVVLARFDAQGNPQTGFGNGGAVAIDIGDGRHFRAGRVALQPDGKLVVAGSLPNAGPDTTPHFAAMRILADYETIFADGFDGR